MALYLSVAAVQAEGDAIEQPPSGDPPAVAPGRRVIAVVENGAWQTALDVSHPDTYRRLHQRLADGIWRALRLYSLDETRALALADGRRATMEGRPVPDPGRPA